MARRNNNRQHVSLLMYNSSEGISAPLREFIEGLLEGDVSKVAKHVRSRRKSNDSSSAKIALDQPVLENLLPLFLAVLPSYFLYLAMDFQASTSPRPPFASLS